MSTLETILHYLDTTARVSCPQITCEQAAEIAAMLRARNRELMDVHDALHRECDGNADLPAEIRALRKEREELADERDKILGHFVELTESRTKFDLDCWVFQQVACGFAWDCGREMACLKEKAQENARYWMGKAMSRRQIDAVEATGDLDPGVYEGTGKGFEK